jgi:flavodoxin
MQALVIFDSTFGNTEEVAFAIAEGLGERYTVRVTAAAEAGPLTASSTDLLVIGGPTHKRHMSPQLRTLMKTLPPNGLRGARAATFDTRYHMSRLLSGSAARDAARALTRAGCRLIAPPESFFMEKDDPPRGEKRRHRLEHLEPGEIERAKVWASNLARQTSSPMINERRLVNPRVPDRRAR